MESLTLRAGAFRNQYFNGASSARFYKINL